MCMLHLSGLMESCTHMVELRQVDAGRLQVAPTVLGFLGLDPAALDSVKEQPGNPTVAILSGQNSYHG